MARNFHREHRRRRSRARVAWLASLLTSNWLYVQPEAPPPPLPIVVDYDTPPLIDRGGVGAACHWCMKNLEGKRIVRGFFCSVRCAVANREAK